MDELSNRLERLERRVRALLAVIALLGALIATQTWGWAPALRKERITVEEIVVASESGHPTVEIGVRGIRLVDPVSGALTWLAAPSTGGSPGLSVSGPKGHTDIGGGEIGVATRDGGTVEVRGGASPVVTILGKQSGQTDIGPGFASVSGRGSSAIVDGRRDSLGIRVLDEKGQPVGPR